MEHPSHAKALLFATGKLGSFAASVGLELVPEVCLHSSVIERFILLGYAQLSPAGSRRTLRTNLRFVARAVLVLSFHRLRCRCQRERSKAPYTDAEIASFLALADAQPNRARRHRLAALDLSRGGGRADRRELQHVTGIDIVRRSGGVVVEVRNGRRARRPGVGLLPGPPAAAGLSAKERYLIGGRDPNRRET